MRTENLPALLTTGCRPKNGLRDGRGKELVGRLGSEESEVLAKLVRQLPDRGHIHVEGLQEVLDVHLELVEG